MLNTQPLDLIPLWLLYGLTVGLLLLFAEIGFRLGRLWQARAPEKDSAIGAMVGAMLALLAFLLAFLVSEASGRFDARRALVMEEATAIQDAYRRAGYLPEEYKVESRELLREYVDVRLEAVVPGQLAGAVARSEEIHDALWARAESLILETGGSDVYALYLEALGEVMDVHMERLILGVYARIPTTLLLLVYIMALLSMLILGFANSYDGKRSGVALVTLVLIFGAVLFLIVDLDRSTQGLLQVSQQPLVELQKQLNR